MQSALDLGVPITGIAEATFARSLSGHTAQRAAAREMFSTTTEGDRLDVDPEAFTDDVRAALYASKVVAYAQGFDQIAAGAEEHGWDIDLGQVAKIWRDGCIIRARFLGRITEAYADEPDLTTLLTTPFFADAVKDGVDAWRRVVAAAATGGIPDAGLLLVPGLLRRAAARATSRGAHPGPARQLRRPHLPARRPAGHLPHRVGR